MMRLWRLPSSCMLHGGCAHLLLALALALEVATRLALDIQALGLALSKWRRQWRAVCVCG